MKSTLVNACGRYSLSLAFYNRPSEINSFLKKAYPLLRKCPLPAYEESIHGIWRLFSLPLLFVCYLRTASEKKRSQGQQIEIANIHISARAISWPLSQYPQCLRLFTILLALTPTLPPSVPAPLLLALGVVVLGVSSLLPIKTWQRLPVFVHTPTEASLSAFGRTALKSEGKATRWREGREEGGEGEQLNVQI